MKKVCFATFTRSDYTSLKHIIKAAKSAKLFQVSVLAGGSHLLHRFGNSIEQIKKDGIEVDFTIDFLSESDDSDNDMAEAFLRAYQGCLNYLLKEKPDCVFLLGDRWEMLAMSQAANLVRVPIIHHSGGDITQGSLDNQTRYTLTTQAHIHLTALEEHRERLIAIGEEEWRVTTVGEPALTEVTSQADGVEDIYKELGFESEEKFVLATFHPTTFESASLEKQIDIFLKTLDLVPETIVLTAPNPDPGSKAFFDKLFQYVESNNRIHFFENLGAKRYYASMRAAEYMVGNSSSGIWEAPSFKLPVLNMGSRQKDRLRADNVLDVDLDIEKIEIGLKKIRSLKFKEQLKKIENPYVKENCLELILKCIQESFLRDNLLMKKFIDPLKTNIN